MILRRLNITLLTLCIYYLLYLNDTYIYMSYFYIFLYYIIHIFYNSHSISSLLPCGLHSNVTKLLASLLTKPSVSCYFTNCTCYPGNLGHRGGLVIWNCVLNILSVVFNNFPLNSTIVDSFVMIIYFNNYSYNYYLNICTYEQFCQRFFTKKCVLVSWVWPCYWQSVHFKAS